MALHVCVMDPPGSMFRDRKFWTTTITEFQRSGLSQEAFAARQRVSVGTLRGWIYRLRRERTASVSLVPVRVIASTAPEARQSSAQAIEVDVAGSVRVRFPIGADVEYIAQLIKRLG
jgi:hypothetical protein